MMAVLVVVVVAVVVVRMAGDVLLEGLLLDKGAESAMDGLFSGIHGKGLGLAICFIVAVVGSR